jgi:hypothetical protein
MERVISWNNANYNGDEPDISLTGVMFRGIEVPPPPEEKRVQTPTEDAKYFCPICMFYYDSILYL